MAALLRRSSAITILVIAVMLNANVASASADWASWNTQANTNNTFGQTIPVTLPQGVSRPLASL